MKPARYVVKHGSAARVMEACDLRPPLEPTWALRYRTRVVDLPLIDPERLYVQYPGTGVAALDVVTHETLWQYVGGGPLALDGERLVVVAPTGEIVALDPRTGGHNLSVQQRAGIEAVTVGDLLVGQTFQKADCIYGVDLRRASTLWTWVSDAGTFVSCLFCASNEAVCFGLDKGAVIALDPHSGAQLWRQSIADLTYSDMGTERPGQVQNVAMLYDGKVLFDAHRWGSVAYSVKNGKRLWAQPIPGGAYASSVYGARLYVLSTRGQLFVLDPETGNVESSKALKAAVSKKETVPAKNPLLISETHIFAGSHEGYVLAFERETGKYVWSYRPKGGASIGGYFACANGRLYYADASFTIHCLAQVLGGS